MSVKRSGGRPANEEASAALKAAALRLVRETGYEKVSIAAIIAEAGVARQTLYNRWDTKALNRIWIARKTIGRSLKTS